MIKIPRGNIQDNHACKQPYCTIKIRLVICSIIIHTLNYTGDQGDKIIHINNPTKYSGAICELSDKKEI